MSKKTAWILLAAVSLASAAKAEDCVKTFAKPPTQEEIAAALEPDAPALRAKCGSRNLKMFKDAEGDESDKPPKADAPASAAADSKGAGSSTTPAVPVAATGATTAAASPVATTGAAPAATPTVAVAPPVADGPAHPAPTVIASVAPTAATTAPVNVDAQPSRAEVGGRAVALPIHFDLGSATVLPESRAFVESIGQYLQHHPSVNLLIEGHTDRLGSDRVNMMLSWDRAFAVFRTLVTQYGIDPARLQPLGKGSTDPLPGSSPFDPQNRRVQFRVFG